MTENAIKRLNEISQRKRELWELKDEYYTKLNSMYLELKNLDNEEEYISIYKKVYLE